MHTALRSLPVDSTNPALQQCIVEFRERRRHYKREKNSLLRWVGTAYLAIVAIVSIVNATGDLTVQFTIGHMMMFHGIAAVVFFCWLRMEYRIEETHIHERVVEHVLRHRLGASELATLQQLDELRAGCNATSARWLMVIANCLIGLIYIITSIVPVTRVSINDDMLGLNLEGVLSMMTAICILVVGFILYRHARQRVRSAHNNSAPVNSECLGMKFTYHAALQDEEREVNTQNSFTGRAGI